MLFSGETQHDLWYRRLAHWLGRPSHINELQFNVSPLTMGDFAEQMGTADQADLRPSTEAFVRLSKLTLVLSKVLDSFYLVHRNPCAMTPEEALSRAGECQAKLNDCLAQEGLVLLQSSRVVNGEFEDQVFRTLLKWPSDYAFVFAYYCIAVSIQRALFACVGGTSYYDLERERVLFQDLFGFIKDLLEQRLDGLWLSCEGPPFHERLVFRSIQADHY